MTLISQKDLHKHGVAFSREHIRRLVKSGAFPKPIKFGARGSRIAWIAEEVDAWIAAKIAARNAQPSA